MKEQNAALLLAFAELLCSSRELTESGRTEIALQLKTIVKEETPSLNQHDIGIYVRALIKIL